MAANCTHNRGLGLTHVLTIGTCKVWAGSEAQVRSHLENLDLVISLNIVTWQHEGYRMNESALALLPRLGSTVIARPLGVITLDWKDGKRPPVDDGFWSLLIKDLAKLRGHAAIHCWAGHGRTGTALAILAHLTGICRREDPVLWVRDQYCGDVIETREQIDYLKSLGIQTDARGIHETPTRRPDAGLDDADEDDDDELERALIEWEQVERGDDDTQIKHWSKP